LEKIVVIHTGQFQENIFGTHMSKIQNDLIGISKNVVINLINLAYKNSQLIDKISHLENSWLF